MYLNETLGLIARVRFWTKGARHASPDLSVMEADGALEITLTPQLADSIRSGFGQTLDTGLLRRIEQPTGRALYRLLEAHREHDQAGSLRVTLEDWGQACGIPATQSDKIRRTLGSAHEELQANAYLEDVIFEGRGQQQRIEYLFRRKNAPDPALVKELLLRGVSKTRAEQLVRDYSARVEDALAFLKHRESRGVVKNPGGLLADFLQTSDKYVWPLPGSTESPSTPKTDQIIQQRQEEAARDERAAQEQYDARQAALMNAPGPVQWRATKSSLLLLLRKHLSSQDLSELEVRCMSGALSATRLAQQAAAASARLELSRFVSELQQQLQS
ncbi:hypothetical protein GCM10008957_23440 [Deinococcus ruber]|uniref:Uncharacterized protein n=2 Tax=Deinococcus ruber TaxID=1848197 RepID=A0A918C8D7_9DEIO|nr:hypothetical protein GCM10008957_23440 [Deinococcus ruber]